MLDSVTQPLSRLNAKHVRMFFVFVFLLVFCLYCCCCCLFYFLFVCLLAGSDQAFCFWNARPRYKLSGARPAVGRFTERSHFPPHDVTAAFKHHTFQVLQQKSDWQSWLSFLPHQKQSWLQKETNKQNPDNSLKNSQSFYCCRCLHSLRSNISFQKWLCVLDGTPKFRKWLGLFVACCKSVVILCVLWLGPHIYDDSWLRTVCYCKRAACEQLPL